MKLDEQTELISYLSDVVKCCRSLKLTVGSRNKTKKFKALTSMLTIIEARADSTLRYARAGGYSELPLLMQKQMYTPIMEYLATEVSS